uniref:Uncharacterized protein n=1 Tax=Eutreptiella gymnastica TaxID=73025 RepID=A0A7S1JCY1_9EUGL|mmetsp:Transcript_86836/g.151151  ORF Transcript_86836/g.151151 Transcript_86836/m.151151 type:complete len:764 (+) Transcript_86836:162-2453(+)
MGCIIPRTKQNDVLDPCDSVMKFKNYEITALKPFSESSYAVDAPLESSCPYPTTPKVDDIIVYRDAVPSTKTSQPPDAPPNGNVPSACTILSPRKRTTLLADYDYKMMMHQAEIARSPRPSLYESTTMSPKCHMVNNSAKPLASPSTKVSTQSLVAKPLASPSTTMSPRSPMARPQASPSTTMSTTSPLTKHSTSSSLLLPTTSSVAKRHMISPIGPSPKSEKRRGPQKALTMTSSDTLDGHHNPVVWKSPCDVHVDRCNGFPSHDPILPYPHLDDIPKLNPQATNDHYHADALNLNEPCGPGEVIILYQHPAFDLGAWDSATVESSSSCHSTSSTLSNLTKMSSSTVPPKVQVPCLWLDKIISWNDEEVLKAPRGSPMTKADIHQPSNFGIEELNWHHVDGHPHNMEAATQGVYPHGSTLLDETTSALPFSSNQGMLSVQGEIVDSVLNAPSSLPRHLEPPLKRTWLCGNLTYQNVYIMHRRSQPKPMQGKVQAPVPLVISNKQEQSASPSICGAEHGFDKGNEIVVPKPNHQQWRPHGFAKRSPGIPKSHSYDEKGFRDSLEQVGPPLDVDTLPRESTSRYYIQQDRLQYQKDNLPCGSQSNLSLEQAGLPLTMDSLCCVPFDNHQLALANPASPLSPLCGIPFDCQSAWNSEKDYDVHDARRRSNNTPSTMLPNTWYTMDGYRSNAPSSIVSMSGSPVNASRSKLSNLMLPTRIALCNVARRFSAPPASSKPCLNKGMLENHIPSSASHCEFQHTLCQDL